MGNLDTSLQLHAGEPVTPRNRRPHLHVWLQSTKATPLRVVRSVDVYCTSHSAGRMVISGRFSEVCDALDQLSRQAPN